MLGRVAKAVWSNQLWLVTGSTVVALLGLWWQRSGDPAFGAICLAGSVCLFGTAFHQAWREESVRIEAERQQQARPQMAGEILAGIFRCPYHLPEDVETGVAHVILKVAVSNGRPTPVRIRNWRLWIDLDGTPHAAKGPLYIPDKSVFYLTDPIPGMVEEQIARTEYPTPRLDEMALHHSIRPDASLAGWLWFTVPDVAAEQVRDFGALVLEMVDDAGRTHIIRRETGLEWDDKVGVLDYTYLGDAYNLRWMDGNKPLGFI